MKKWMFVVSCLMACAACKANAKPDNPGNVKAEVGTEGGAAETTLAPKNATRSLVELKALADSICKDKGKPDFKTSACAAVDRLRSAAKAVVSAPPEGSVVGPATWSGSRGRLMECTSDLEKGCKGKLPEKLIGLSVGSMSEIAADMIEQTKPRTLPTTLQAYDQELRRQLALKPGEQRKGDHCDKLKKLSDAIPSEAPKGIDADKWKSLVDKVKGYSYDRQSSCDEEDASDFDEATSNAEEAFYQLVVLLPSNAK